MPQPPGGGGSAAVVTLIQQQVSYPPRAVRDHAEGRVFVSFTVAPTGLIEDVDVVKGFRPDCDSAVVAAVKRLPRFEPGRQTGRAVPVRFTAPVTFRLQAASAALPDSVLRVYTYVQYMPKYKGEEGTKKLTEDLQREFKKASAAGGCTPPAGPVVVTFTVGPSGVIYGVKSVNNLVLSSASPAPPADAKGGNSAQSRLLPLPDACEAALVAAARQLPRLTPGSQSGRAVAVSYTIKLLGPGQAK